MTYAVVHPIRMMAVANIHADRSRIGTPDVRLHPRRAPRGRAGGGLEVPVGLNDAPQLFRRALLRDRVIREAVGMPALDETGGRRP